MSVDRAESKWETSRDMEIVALTQARQLTRTSIICDKVGPTECISMVDCKSQQSRVKMGDYYSVRQWRMGQL